MSPLSLSDPSGRFLTLLEREQIAVGVARGESIRQIARDLGRHPSTVLRELRRNRGSLPRYRGTAHDAPTHLVGVLLALDRAGPG